MLSDLHTLSYSVPQQSDSIVILVIFLLLTLELKILSLRMLALDMVQVPCLHQRIGTLKLSKAECPQHCGIVIQSSNEEPLEK